MRIRSIKPEFWKSDDTAALTDWNDRLVFIGLWSYVDDNGVGRDNENLIRSELFGLEEDTIEASSRVRRALEHLAERGLITRYAASDGRRFFHVTNWHHQKIDRPTPPRYPLPTSEDVVFDEPSTNPRRAIDDDSLRAREGSGIRDQGSGIEKRPSAEPMATVYPQAFEAFWEHYPRKVGKKRALAQWRSARRRISDDDLVAAARRFAADPNLPDEQFIPHPEKWLSRDGWTDAPYPPRVPQQRRSTTDLRVADGLALVAHLEHQQQLEIS